MIGESTEGCAPLMGAQHMLEMDSKCAKGMGQRSNRQCVTTKEDAQIKLKLEECANSMGQRSNCAAVMDAKIMLKTEESAGLMVSNPNAAILDAKTSPLEEACVGRMGQKIM